METTILLWIHGLASPALDAAFRFSNLFGLFTVCTAVVTAMVAWHALRGEREAAFAWLLVGLASSLLPELVKQLAERPRPSLWPTIVHATGYSFPSGHAVASAAFYPLLGWDLLRGSQAAGRVGFALGALFATFVGLGRLYLGVHWPSDVLVGWLLGFVMSGLAVAFLARRRAVGRPRL